MNFDVLVKKTMEPLGAKKKLVNIIQIKEEELKVENSVEKCNYKTHISSTLNCPIGQSLLLTYLSLNFLATFFAQTTNTDY